jgi:hypothetical protein
MGQSSAEHLGEGPLIVHICRGYKYVQYLQVDEAIAQNQIIRLSTQLLCQNQKDERGLQEVRPEESIH